jgi:pyruvate dehydrogenase E1 component alpha subunit
MRDRVDLLRDMTLVRQFEERCARLYQESKIRGFLHLYVGEEAVAAGVIGEMEPDDNLVATYREHGHALLKGVSPEAVMAEMFGKAEGCSGGRGGSMHLFDVEHRLFGGHGIVGGGLPVAVGLALADKLRGVPRVTACFFGEGAMAEGEFHECLNLAALWELPVLFCCENNLYAMGTALERSEADTDLAVRAATYGVASWSVDGMDVDAVQHASRRALAMTRGGQPCFVEFRTYRFRAHSMYDPELYRDRDEVARWRERDPIVLLRNRLETEGLLPEGHFDVIRAEADAAVDRAVAFAEAGTEEGVDTLTRHVYAEVGP